MFTMFPMFTMCRSILSQILLVSIQLVTLSEMTVEGDGEPLGEGLLGAVLESRGYGPLDRRHQREASAWLHGHCFHKQSQSSLTILTS